MLVVSGGWAKVLYSPFVAVDLRVLILFFFHFFGRGYSLTELLYMQVKEQGAQKGEASPFLAELLRLEEQAKQQGLGRWSKVFLVSFLSMCSTLNIKLLWFLGYDKLSSSGN